MAPKRWPFTRIGVTARKTERTYGHYFIRTHCTSLHQPANLTQVEQIYLRWLTNYPCGARPRHNRASLSLVVYLYMHEQRTVPCSSEIIIIHTHKIMSRCGKQRHGLQERSRQGHHRALLSNPGHPTRRNCCCAQPQTNNISLRSTRVKPEPLALSPVDEKNQ